MNVEEYWVRQITTRDRPDDAQVQFALNTLYTSKLCEKQGFGSPLSNGGPPEMAWCLTPGEMVDKINWEYCATQNYKFMSPIMPTSMGSPVKEIPEDMRVLWDSITELTVKRVADEIPTSDYEVLHLLHAAHQFGFGCFHPSVNRLVAESVSQQTVPTNILTAWQTLGRACAIGYAFKDKAFLLKKPDVFNHLAGKIHGDGEPAIAWYGRKQDKRNYIFALNGVVVPSPVAMLPADEIGPALITTISSLEVARELINKLGGRRFPAKLVTEVSNIDIRRLLVEAIGYERVVSELNGETLDKKTIVSKQPILKYPEGHPENCECDRCLNPEVTGWRKIKTHYRLISLNLGRWNRPWLYLKMENPSTGHIHVEAVPNECTTVMEALEFRNKSKELPSQLA